LGKNHSIFISHHPNDVEKAREIANALLQIEYLYEDNINFLETISPGSNVQNEILNFIKYADIIIVLPSSSYLIDCKNEYTWIKNSLSYQNKKVLPIPFPNTLWKLVFPDIMPLPKVSFFANVSFGEEWLFNIVTDVESILKKASNSRSRHIPLMVARADSNSTESSQVFPHDDFGISLRKDEILVLIQGDSMSPRFEEGDYVICTPTNLEDILADNPKKRKTCVIRTKNQGTLLKYIGKIKSQTITLVSENTSHDNMVLEETEIDRIFLVVKSVKVRNEY
jgi:hypothetical protein